MPPMMPGTSTRRQLAMAASLRFHSTSTAKRLSLACLTALRVVPSACPCIPLSHSTIPTATVRSHLQCPLILPEKTGQTCEHEQFAKGKGCVKDVNWELGGIQRVTLDRAGPLFHVLYNQRTGCERVNARAKELGIERPKVRNGRSVAHLNTLIYVIVNVRVLEKAKSINKRLLPMN